MDIISEIKRAVQFAKQQKLVEAKKIYLNILKLEPGNAVVMSMLGLLYIKMGMYKRAVQYLTKSYKIKPLETTAEGLGIAYCYLDHSTKAKKYFELVIDKSVNFDVYNNYVKLLLEEKTYKLAYKYALKGYEIFPLRPEILSNLIDASLYVGKLAEAYDLAFKIVKSFPLYGEGWEQYGLVNEVLYKDYELAEKCYKKALKYGAGYSAIYNLAINHCMRGNYRKSLNYLKKIDSISEDKSDMSFLIQRYISNKKNLIKHTNII